MQSKKKISYTITKDIVKENMMDPQKMGPNSNMHKTKSIIELRSVMNLAHP